MCLAAALLGAGAIDLNEPEIKADYLVLSSLEPIVDLETALDLDLGHLQLGNSKIAVPVVSDEDAENPKPKN